MALSIKNSIQTAVVEPPRPLNPPSHKYKTIDLTYNMWKQHAGMEWKNKLEPMKENKTKHHTFSVLSTIADSISSILLLSL